MTDLNREPVVGESLQIQGRIGEISEVADGTLVVEWDAFGGPFGSSSTRNIPTANARWAENVGRWLA